MVKVCPVCGEEFITKGNGKACSADCKLELIKRAQRKYEEKRKFAKRTGKPVGRPRKAHKEHTYIPTKNDTLCWSCQNATGGCSWSKALKPVRGWKTKRRILKHNEKGEVTYSQSYKVESCPKYRKDS